MLASKKRLLQLAKNGSSYELETCSVMNKSISYILSKKTYIELSIFLKDTGTLKNSNKDNFYRKKYFG